MRYSLVKLSDWKGFLTVDSQLPVGNQIILVYFNPYNNQLVLLGRKLVSQDSSIMNRVDDYLALIFRTVVTRGVSGVLKSRVGKIR